MAKRTVPEGPAVRLVRLEEVPGTPGVEGE